MKEKKNDKSKDLIEDYIGLVNKSEASFKLGIATRFFLSHSVFASTDFFLLSLIKCFPFVFNILDNNS